MVIREPDFVFGEGGVVFVTGVGWELEAGGGDSVVVTATQSWHNAVTEEVMGGFDQVKRRGQRELMTHSAGHYCRVIL